MILKDPKPSIVLWFRQAYLFIKYIRLQKNVVSNIILFKFMDHEKDFLYFSLKKNVEHFRKF